MNYPSLEEVEKASQYELGRWKLFLPSPGMRAIDAGMEGEKLDEHQRFESMVMSHICERFLGWTTQLNGERS